jgi:hypothetical protein
MVDLPEMLSVLSPNSGYSEDWPRLPMSSAQGLLLPDRLEFEWTVTAATIE